MRQESWMDWYYKQTTDSTRYDCHFANANLTMHLFNESGISDYTDSYLYDRDPISDTVFTYYEQHRKDK